MTEKAPGELTSSREDILGVLDRISLFGGLSPEQLESLFGLLGEVSYAAGEQVFARGDQPSHIYILLRGQVRLDFGSKGHPLSGLEFGPGDCFGETSAVGIQAHSASAIAAQDATLLVLPRTALLSLYETNTELFAMLVLNIAREASRRLHQTDQWIAELLKTNQSD